MDEHSLGTRRDAWSDSKPLVIAQDPERFGGAAGPAPLFDFAGVWRLFRRRVKLIAFVTILAVGATVILDRLSPEVYTASTRILLDEQSISPFDGEEVFADLRLTNPVVESQMQVMRSPYLLSQVVDRLNLSENETFMAPPTTPLRDQFGELLSYLSLGATEPVEPPSPAMRFQAAVETLQDNLTVSRNAQTLVIRIRFSATSPDLAADVVNAVADTYIENRLGIRQDAAQRAAEWFDARMLELNGRTLEVEQEIARLSGSASGPAQAGAPPAATLQTARQALQDAMAERARAQSEALRLRTALESERGLRGIPDGLATGTLGSLIREASDARDALSDALQNGGETGAVENLTMRVEMLEAAGASLLTAVVEEAEIRLDQAQAAETDARAMFETARGAGDVTNTIDVELRELEGEARIYRELHDTYLESYLRTIQQQSFPSTEATVIQTAIAPEFPDGPGLSRLGILGVFVGLAIGAGSAFVIEAADSRIRTVSQLSKAARAPVLGVLPHRDLGIGGGSNHARLHLPKIKTPNRSRRKSQEVIALPENRVSLLQDSPQMYAAITNPLSQFSEAIRRVNVEVDTVRALAIPDNSDPVRIVAFISDKPSQGRSIAAVNYAEMLAVGGSQTLLVDLDWTGLFLTGKITPSAQFGLAELSLASSSIGSEQAFWYDERTSLYFLPNRSLAANAELDPGVFDQTRQKRMIQALAGKFDTVVLDLSPMAFSSDPAAMAEIVSGFIAVADWGKTTSASLSAELRRAAIHPPKLLGTLLNGVSSEQLQRYETAA